MATFGEYYRKNQSAGKESQQGGGVTTGSSFGAYYRKTGQAKESYLQTVQLEEKKQQAIVDKANMELQQQQAQQRAIQEAAATPFHNPIAFLRGATGLAASALGVNSNDVLPEDPKAPQQYQDLRAEQIKQQASLAPGKFGLNWADRATGAIGEAMKPIGSVVGALITANQATNPFISSTPQDTQQAQAGIADIAVGGVEKTLEISSGLGKFSTNVALNTDTWMPPEVGLAANLAAKATGVSLEEYKKQIRTKIDDAGILNYHPEYANDVQKGTAQIIDIGTWFIPITRSKVAVELTTALSEMPKVAELLGRVPRLVKIGEKLGFAVDAGKDATDVALLTAMQGKTWDEVKTDAETAGVFGLALHGFGKVFSTIKMKSDLKSVDSFFTKEGKELTDVEAVKADNMIKSGTPKTEVIDTIVLNRKTESADKFLKILGEKDAQVTKAIAELKTPIAEKPVIAEKKVTIEDIKPNAVVKKDGTIAKADLAILKEKVATKTEAQVLKEEFKKEYDALKAEIVKTETGKATKEQALLLNQAKDSVAAMEQLKKVLPAEVIKDIQAKTAAEITSRVEGEAKIPQEALKVETPIQVPKVSPKTPKVSQETRRAAYKVEKLALERKITTERLAEGNVVTQGEKNAFRQSISDAVNLVKDDYEKGKRIAILAESPPPGMELGHVFTQMKKEALERVDIETLRMLAKSEAGTKQALGLKAFDDGVGDGEIDVVKKIKYTQDKMKERIEGISGKSVEKAQKQFIDKELKNYDKIAAQSATKKTHLSKLIDSIKC